MVEYGPFIEYCCELYIHHTVLNIAVAVAVLVCVVLSLLVILALTKRKCFICLSKTMSDYVCSDDNREADAAVSAFDCEDVISNEKE